MEFYEKREAPFEAAEIDLSTKKTEIQNYYTDKTILVTGGTGFLGMLIIEKLLRCCPDIRKLILIVRPKRGKSLHRRMQQLFSGSVYEKMKLSNPDYWKKIEVLNGDCELPYLGQDSDEWSRLQTEVNIILHAAATIRFDEHIKISYNTNVGGTKYLLNLAENAVQLDAFVYVSTAYSQSHLLNIEEEFYPTPFSDQQIMQLIETLDDQTLACMTPIILDGQFNTYTMTKAVAENVVKLYADKLPVAVIRPSIVTSTLEEPLTSWTNSISGATGVFVGAGIGLLRTLYCDENMKAEIIPADRVINALLRIPLHLQKKAAISKTLSSNDGVNLRNNEFTPIYNYISTGKSIKWADTMVLLRGTADSRRLHAKLQLWRHHLKLEKHYYFWMIQFYLVHLAPLPFFLMVEKMAKQKPRIWSAYIKLYHYTKLLSFFMTRTWNFSTKNTSELLSFTSKEDDMLFNANSEIDWNYYFFSMAVGVGTHIVGVNWNSSDQNPLRRYLMEEFYEKREKEFTEAEMIEYPTSKTEIQNYYTDKTILLTGGTGFLGTLVIEKLLRCCSDLKKLILVIRSKRGKSLQQRVKEHFSNPIYEKMKLSNPDYWKKVEILAGDCELPYYGWDSTEWNRLQQEVNIIFHSAATIRFDEHIKISYHTNVGGTKYLLKLAEGATHIDAFVYLSTAYSQAHLQNIEEKFYPSLYSDQQMMQLIEELDSHTLACMTPIILDGRFNTYILMKGMAESIIEQYVDELPVAVFRPSIVTSTYNDPLTSWTNSIAGATALLVFNAIGVVRNLYCNPDLKVEIIPADRVISALLRIPLHLQKKTALGQLTLNSDTNSTTLEKSQRQQFIPIYNYTNKIKVINWGDLTGIFDKAVHMKNLQDVMLVWRQHIKYDKNYTIWLIRFYLVHLFPLPAFMAMERLVKMKPRLWKGYIKVYNYTKLLSFFMVNSWDFSWKNTAELISFTSKDDDVLFNADCKINWDDYISNMCRGLGLYILGLDLDKFTKGKFQKYCIYTIDRLYVWSIKILITWCFVKLVIYLVSHIFPVLIV